MLGPAFGKSLGSRGLEKHHRSSTQCSYCQRGKRGGADPDYHPQSSPCTVSPHSTQHALHIKRGAFRGTNSEEAANYYPPRGPMIEKQTKGAPVLQGMTLTICDEVPKPSLGEKNSACSLARLFPIHHPSCSAPPAPDKQQMQFLFLLSV